MAREYPVKKGIKISRDYIAEKAKGTASNVNIDGDEVICSIPGIKRISLRTDGKNLFVETVNEEKPENPMMTVSLFNKLIEDITGFSAKERKKKMSKL